MAAVIIHYTTRRKIRNFKKLKRQKLPQYRLQKLRNAALLNLKIKNIENSILKLKLPCNSYDKSMVQ